MRYFFVSLLFSISVVAQIVPGKYIVTLEGDPAAASLARKGLSIASARDDFNTERARVRREQLSARQEITLRGGQVIGSLDTVANALIVQMPPEQAAQLQSVSGVRTVYPVGRIKKMLDRALPLHRITDAWALLPNGIDSAGAGIRIGILDTGIATDLPAFQDSSLTPPAGFPKAGTNADLALTNSKVIVARNYTDDPDANDRDGHGTGVAMCAGGETVSGPFGAITGAAPKAFLGNYKIFGGSTNTTDQILRGLNDAVADGMDVINLSIASPVGYPIDLDPVQQAVEAASALGVIVVTAAGNEGPEPNTITSPSTAPSAVAVGASENDRTFYPGTVTISNVAPYQALPGDNSSGGNPVAGVLADIANLDPSALGCGALPAGRLAGKIALILRGTCTFETKLNNAQKAGAIGAIVFAAQSSPAPIFMFQASARVPAVMVSYQDGTDLKSRISGNSNLSATLQFTLTAAAASPRQLASFSSGGPGVGLQVKPDLVAVGDPVSMAAEDTFSDGELYDPSGFTIASGTSFSSPIVAGSVGVLKAARPGFTGAQYRSLIVNSASVFNLDGGASATAQQTGTGVLNLLSSMQNTIASAPVSLSFGTGRDSVSASQSFTLSNLGASDDTVSVSVSVVSTDGIAVPSLSANTIPVAAGAGQNVTLQLNASGLAPGAYQGYVRVQSTRSAVETHIPYWYAVPDTIPAFIGLLASDQQDTAGTRVQFAFTFRVTDAAGVPFPGVVPSVTAVSGGGRVLSVYADDPSLPGTFDVDVRMGLAPGPNIFQVTAGGITHLVQIDGV